MPLVQVPIRPSTNIASAEYDTEAKELVITYHNRSIYKYWPIFPATAELLSQAASPGKFVHQNIKQANFQRLR